MTGLLSFIRHDPPLRTGATAVYPYQPAIERKYRFTSRFGDEVLLHAREDGVLHLPRALCPVGEIDERDPGEPVSFPKCPLPRSEQQAWFEATRAFLEAGLSGITVAGTGRGKTVAGYYVAHHVGRKTLVITTKEDIYKQWIGGACGLFGQPDFLGLPPEQVGEIRQDKCEVIGTRFVVAMIHSLAKPEKYPDWITKGFGLVIFDECQRVSAEHFQAVASMFPARLRLGLSATPERSDGKELLVYAHIGPVRVKAPLQLMVPKVLRCTSSWRCPRRRDGGRIRHEPGRTTFIEKILAADPDRNRLLASLVLAAYRKGRKVVLFSSLIDHLHAIHEAAQAMGIPGHDIGFYIGVATKAERERRERVKVKPVILTTYGMMAEGTDIPWLDTCILAMPRKNIEQPVGRIRREYEDKAEAVVIDVVDQDSPVFAGYATSRLEWYRRVGADVKQMN